MPYDATRQTDLLPWAAYVCTDEGAELARAVVEQAGSGENALRGGGLSGAARLSTGQPIARMLLTEIGNIPLDMACDSVSEIRQTGAEVIVLGQQEDLGTYRALRRAGALDYFTFPVTPKEILAIQAAPPANDTNPVPTADPAAAATGPVIGVMGSNGGVGASVLAQNLAYFAAAPKGASLRTAFIDADLRFGSQAIDLDRDETPGLFEALSAPDRVDDTFLGATMDKLSDNLLMYSQQVRTGQDIAMLEAGLPRLLTPLRQEFEALLLDLPRNALLDMPDLAARLDALIMVMPSGYAGVNAASRLLARISAEAPDLRILPVLSELRRDAGLSRKDMQKAIQRDITAVLPRCDTAICRASRAARPLVDGQPRSAYARAVRGLWLSATEPAPRADAKPARRGLIKRIIG